MPFSAMPQNESDVMEGWVFGESDVMEGCVFGGRM